MTDVLVMNASTLVTDREAAAMARACAYQTRHHAEPFYGALGVHFVPKNETPKPGDWVMTIMDDADQAGDLGWHTQEGEVIYGRIFAKPCLEDGHSSALLGPYAVSSVLSHEILETLGDPHVNDWVEGDNGLLIARELCDPVESYTYAYKDRWAGEVTLSDFVTPEFFDPNSSAGEEYDYLGKAASPFVLTTGGYWVQAGITKETQKFGARIPDGADARVSEERGVTYVFGPDFPEWKKALKMDVAGGRTSRRSAP